jgi:S1-C subfamily serine protease
VLKQAGVAAGTMISKVNGQPVNNLRELCAVLATIEDGQKVPWTGCADVSSFLFDGLCIME